ncbi:sodium pump decarboxylase subunit gamma [bacterium D16-51]|nr:sodium pump decarboxylase subunit gamma [bacterium D16-59]RKI58956.1 sodium pump decarboxylase subunit gamma [bacterium D16-51]
MMGCSLTKENENLDKSKLTKTAEEFAAQWFEYDFKSTVEQYADQMGDEQADSYKEYAKMQKKHGAMKKVVDKSYSTASDTATVTLTLTTEKAGKLVFTVIYSETGEISDWKVEEYQSIGKTMGRAGLNTIMSMAIVFAVLIFISFIISCFKFIGNAQPKEAAKAEAPAAVPAPAPAVVEEENLADDLELVAVITAAIAAASENECTDGLIVRSIVRRS